TGPDSTHETTAISQIDGLHRSGWTVPASNETLRRGRSQQQTEHRAHRHLGARGSPLQWHRQGERGGLVRRGRKAPCVRGAKVSRGQKVRGLAEMPGAKGHRGGDLLHGGPHTRVRRQLVNESGKAYLL